LVTGVVDHMFDIDHMFDVMTVVLSEQTNKIRGVELCCLPGAIEHPAVMSTRKE
jgi:hypothetical protein